MNKAKKFLSSVFGNPVNIIPTTQFDMNSTIQYNTQATNQRCIIQERIADTYSENSTNWTLTFWSQDVLLSPCLVDTIAGELTARDFIALASTSKAMRKCWSPSRSIQASRQFLKDQSKWSQYLKRRLPNPICMIFESGLASSNEFALLPREEILELAIKGGHDRLLKIIMNDERFIHFFFSSLPFEIALAQDDPKVTELIFNDRRIQISQTLVSNGGAVVKSHTQIIQFILQQGSLVNQQEMKNVLPCLTFFFLFHHFSWTNQMCQSKRSEMLVET